MTHLVTGTLFGVNTCLLDERHWQGYFKVICPGMVATGQEIVREK